MGFGASGSAAGLYLIGAGDGGPCQLHSVGKRKNGATETPTKNINWCALWQKNSKKKIAQHHCRVGVCNLTMMIVKRKIWPCLDGDLSESWNLDEKSVWGPYHDLNSSKCDSNMKFKRCRGQAPKQQIHNMSFLSRTFKTDPGAMRRAADCYFILHLTEDVLMLFDRVSCFSLQRSAGVHVEMVSAPDPTCAPVPTARSQHPVAPSQVVQHLLIPTGSSFEPCCLQLNGRVGLYIDRGR